MKRRNVLKFLGLAAIAPQIGLEMLATIKTTSAPMSFVEYIEKIVAGSYWHHGGYLNRINITGSVNYDGGYTIPKEMSDRLLGMVYINEKPILKITSLSISRN